MGSDRTGGIGNDATMQPVPSGEVSTIEPGTVLAGRYLIIDTLGVGGMGAVYKAFDRQLTRVVAIKTILAELAETPTALKRFKQELLLAQKIVHKNVVRIFDIGEDGATKFITMDFIEGVDLKSLIKKKGKLSPQEAIPIIRQVCQGLEAAHAEGVVHRDLKPQNIMVQSNGLAMVMDFGIAQSSQNRNVTQTGAFLGTPEYMSPEQARTEDVDSRSDVFSLGLIFYEMLTGKLPYQSDTVIESMFKRTRERAVPPAEIDRDVPKMANDIIVKCLALEREGRYQTVTELLADLEKIDPAKKVGAVVHATARLKRFASYRTWGLIAAVVLIGVAAGLLVPRLFRPKTAEARAPVTVLVADFSNATGDSVFDGTLESMCTTALEEASFVNVFSRGQARTLLARLQNGATRLDEPAARLVGIREGVSVVVTGSITQQGTGYQISVRAVDATTGKVLATREVTAANSQLVLGSVARLIAPIRTALGDTTPESAQLAAAETYTAGSLAAAHAYALAQENLGSGKSADAIKYYLQAIDLDPNLGRAYSGLAAVQFNMKKREEAGELFKKALALVDRMSEREKYRTLGAYYLSFANNYEQAIETLRKLVFLYPADAAAYTNLSTAYVHLGKMAESVEPSRRAVEITPENLLRRYNYAIHAMYAGDFPTAFTEANRILEKDPNYESAYLTLALSALFRDDVDKAMESYTRLEKVGPYGASLSKMGQADLKIYTGHYEEAVKILLPAITEDEKQSNTGEMAYKLVALAETYNALGRSREAAAAAARAAQSSISDGIQFLAARALVEAGDSPKAQQVTKDLEGRLQNQMKSLSLMITGDMALAGKQIGDAVDRYRKAQDQHDSWIAHYLLGKAYVEAGHFPEAIAELEAAEKRASEATDLFDEDTTTLRYLPPLYYWLGRAQEGLGTADAARKSYQRYLAIRGKGDAADKLLADAKRRAGS
jgi:tetratricopeptide (TPR) repeat protein